MEIPNYVLKVMDALKKGGFESYAIGGCVRDSLLGVTPKDWDLCTSASVEEIRIVLEAFSQVPIGLKHGTILVLSDGQPVDVSTFRQANSPLTGLNQPHFDSLLMDLSMRDFTVNAIACDEKGEIIDPFNGNVDLNNGIIKCVGEAEDRFQEDPLRIMRALRFAATLRFGLNKATEAAMVGCRHWLSEVSAERIGHELSLFITYTDFDLLYNARAILSVVIGGSGSAEDFGRIGLIDSAWLWVAKIVALAPHDTEIRLALLLRSVDGNLSQKYCNESRKILKQLRFSNSTIDTVCLLIEQSFKEINPCANDIKLMLKQIGPEHFRRLLYMQEAIRKAILQVNNTERFSSLPMVEQIFNVIIREKQCYSLSDLAINGGHLITAGFSSGKALGDLLNGLLMEVIEGKTANDKEALLERAKEIKSSQLFYP